jgi:hypothetical protein
MRLPPRLLPDCSFVVSEGGGSDNFKVEQLEALKFSYDITKPY